jgi:hypothetical protein
MTPPPVRELRKHVFGPNPWVAEHLLDAELPYPETYPEFLDKILDIKPDVLNLFNVGKPRPLGGVRVIWLCLKDAFEIAVAKP